MPATAQVPVVSPTPAVVDGGEVSLGAQTQGDVPLVTKSEAGTRAVGVSGYQSTLLATAELTGAVWQCEALHLLPYLSWTGGSLGSRCPGQSHDPKPTCGYVPLHWCSQAWPDSVRQGIGVRPKCLSECACVCSRVKWYSKCTFLQAWPVSV